MARPDANPEERAECPATPAASRRRFGILPIWSSAAGGLLSLPRLGRRDWIGGGRRGLAERNGQPNHCRSTCEAPPVTMNQERGL
eukprot:4716761-Amphidinium_carterae.1